MSDTKFFWRLAPAYRSAMTSPRPEIIKKMSLELFRKVPAGAIETLFDKQNQLLFKRTDLGKYLGIRNIRDNFKEFSSHHSCPKSEIGGAGVTDPRGRTKNSHDILLNLDKAIEILFALKNPRQLP